MPTDITHFVFIAHGSVPFDQVFDVDSLRTLFVGDIAIVQIASDACDIASDVGDIASDVGDIAADVGDIAADAGDIAADVGDITSDV